MKKQLTKLLNEKHAAIHRVLLYQKPLVDSPGLAFILGVSRQTIWMLRSKNVFGRKKLPKPFTKLYGPIWTIDQIFEYLAN